MFHGNMNSLQLFLEHDPEKWEPVSRLREARFGGRRKVGKDHAQIKKLEPGSDSIQTDKALARTFGWKTGFHFS